MSGTLKKIWIKRANRGPMDSVEDAILVEGEGIRGNANQRGKRQVTTIEEEVWNELMRELEADVDPSACRANLMICGVPLRESHGKILRIGSCAIEIYGETKPCERMDDALPCLKNAMKENWRGGAFGVVVKGGEIHVGDEAGFVSE